MSVGTDFVAPRGKRTRSLDSGPSGGAGASRRNKITGIPIFRAFPEMSHYIGTFGGLQSAPPDGTLPKNVKTVVTVMPGHLSAACQTSRQHKCENASTLCSGIKPRQRSAGRPPPGPQTSPWPRSWLRTGRPSAPVERGASALAQVVAQDRAPVCPGGPGGKATWPRSGPRTGRPSAPVYRGARRPGPGWGPGPGAGLPRWTGGQGDLAQVGAQDRAPVCPGGPGGKATWPR